MSDAENGVPVTDAEADALFAALIDEPALVLAVSGGPDSTALLVLTARWRKRHRRGPTLLAVTIDHGLRPESRREAVMVKQLARRLGVAHRTMRWTGRKPATALQEKARAARYVRLAEAARRVQARCVLTAHTLDDQAETVLFRMARGSGLTGLAAMAPVTPMAGIFIVRPLLDLAKARLIATLRADSIPFAEDPSNKDPRFTRPRLRALMPVLAREGLGAKRFAVLARRLRRADVSIETVVEDVIHRLAPGLWSDRGPIAIERKCFADLTEEIALRLLGRAIARVGDEGPVELGKLESLTVAARAVVLSDPPHATFRRTLAGALVTLRRDRLTVERAPPRRSRAGRSNPRVRARVKEEKA